ncbi:MAG TPA: ABC transporter ATP-binding protein [Symbiobacteriaceae bacterium]|nr:ABC transporter ATP-binding protein [Symbiobacteriaceae bacterium]
MIPAISTEGLTKRFGAFTAVNDLSLTVPTGAVMGLLGPNGAGKTTFIRMLLGVLAPTSGTGQVLGHDLHREPDAVRAKTGYMSQRFALYNDLTIEENLAFYGQVYGLKGAPLKERQAELLAWSGLTTQRRAPAGGLGGGLRQRLAFACAILHRPQLLLLDEPTSGVDPTSRKTFWDLIYGLADGGTTVLVSTHYMEEAEHCDRLAMIMAGRLVAEGRPRDLRAQYADGGSLDEVFVRLVKQAR